MAPHLLRIEHPIDAYDELIAAARQAGHRVGSLEWLVDADGACAPVADYAPGSLPAGLEAAAERGVLRAVAVVPGRSVAVKPMRGEPVLRDVLREHFRGCRLVLIRAAGNAMPEVPVLEPLTCPPTGEPWQLIREGRPPRSWTLEKLVAALSRPRPWD